MGSVATLFVLLGLAAGLVAAWPPDPLGALQMAGWLLFLAVPFAVAVGGWRLLAKRPGGEARVPRGVVPVPPVESRDVAGLPRPVTACPDCGFLGVRMPTIGDGLWPGGGELGDRVVCPRCGYQGLAASFADGEDYRAFVASLQPSQA